MPLDGPVDADLMQAVARLAQASITHNTRRAYRAALRGFGASPFPETNAGVAAYLMGLFQQRRATSCAAIAVAALRFRARQSGRPSPAGIASSRVLAGFRRLAWARGRGQVVGVHWEQADRASELAEQSGNLKGLHDAAILTVASDPLLRVCEVEALDVNLEEQTLLIRHSKTDQEGWGVVQYLGRPTVERVRAWLLAAGVTEGALFRAVKAGRVKDWRLTNRIIRRVIKDRSCAAGVGGRVSGHSLRVGSAQSLATAGVSLVEMQVAQHGAVARRWYGAAWERPDKPAA